jgi:hypothetical protein
MALAKNAEFSQRWNTSAFFILEVPNISPPHLGSVLSFFLNTKKHII